MDLILQIGLCNLLMAGLLALLAAMVGRCWRRPALTHALWLLVLAKLLTPPLLPVPVFWTRAAASQSLETEAVTLVLAPQDPDAGADKALGDPVPEVPEAAEMGGPLVEEIVFPVERAENAPGPAPAAPPAETLDHVAALSSWPLVCGAAWLAGSACCFVLAWRRARRFQRVLRYARPAPAETQAEARALSDRMQVRCPAVWLVPGVLAPMLWVMGRTRCLLLPENLLQRLNGEQRATLLVHELAHLRRRDPWVRYLELAVLALYWWCPLVWWARRELREAEEECCDAWVLWVLPGSARAYALALVETVDFLSEARPALPLLASGFGHAQTLRRRLTMIMRGTTPRALTASGAIAVLMLGALLLPLLPTWAQAPQDDPPPAVEPEDKQDRKEKESAREAIQRLRKEHEKLRAQIHLIVQDIKSAQEEFDRLVQKGLDTHKQRETNKKLVPPPLNVPGTPGRPGMPMGIPLRLPIQPDMERRLRELEKKLAEALHEIQELRRQLKAAPGAVQPLPVPAPPGPNVPRLVVPPGAAPLPNPPPLGYIVPLKNTR